MIDQTVRIGPKTYAFPTSKSWKRDPRLNLHFLKALFNNYLNTFKDDPYLFHDNATRAKIIHITTHKSTLPVVNYPDNDNNNKVTENFGMCRLAKDYFLELFQKKKCVTGHFIIGIRQTVDDYDNELFTAPFTKKEFCEAMFSMHPYKCPSHDGYNPGFYQHFQNLCGGDIFKEFCAWHHKGWLPATLNMMNIDLVPKGSIQITMKDLCPIALCNVLYKLVSVVLANRLEVVLSKCISDNQSAFVPIRSISYNVMVAIDEVIHYMKTKKGNDNCVALKLDIIKAYGMIVWEYMREPMSKMGFGARRI